MTPEAITAGVQASDPESMQELGKMAGRFRPFFLKHIGPQDSGDLVNDLFVVAASAIQAGRLEHPERLMPFLCGIARFKVWNIKTDNVTGWRGSDKLTSTMRASTDVYLEACHAEQSKMMRTALHAMKPSRRELLTRHLCGQSPEEIAVKMHKTASQVWRMQWMAKTELTKATRSAASAHRLHAPRKSPHCLTV